MLPTTPKGSWCVTRIPKRGLTCYSVPVFLLASTGLKLAFALIFLIAALQKMAFYKIVKLHYPFWLLSTPSTHLPFVRIFKKKEGTSTTLGWSALHFACQNTALFLGWHDPSYSLSTLNWKPWGSERYILVLLFWTRFWFETKLLGSTNGTVTVAAFHWSFLHARKIEIVLPPVSIWYMATSCSTWLLQELWSLKASG